MRNTLITLFLLCLYSISSRSEPITVVELFTSQGCNSCPLADSLLGKLKKQTNTIAFACHVTYWNYLGWKDTFSLPFCDRRQHGYQHALQGRAGVYTPQMLINGRYAAVGIDENRVNRLIAKAKQDSPIVVAITKTSANQLTIELPMSSAQQKQQVFLLGTSGDHQIPIKKGENGGKTLSYHNPVVEAVNLGNWNGQAKTIKHSLKDQNQEVREWVVIAQKHPLGNITAAGKLSVD